MLKFHSQTNACEPLVRINRPGQVKSMKYNMKGKREERKGKGIKGRGEVPLLLGTRMHQDWLSYTHHHLHSPVSTSEMEYYLQYIYCT